MNRFPLIAILAFACHKPADTDTGLETGDTDTEDTSAPDADSDGSPDGVDCDDTNAAVHPDASETCNGVDDDCDTATDEDATDAVSLYVDGDSDEHGAGAAQVTCPAAGLVASDDDCNDADKAIHPGATDTPYDGIDSDCKGDDDNDADHDGDADLAHGGGDCDDTDPLVFTGDGCRPPTTTDHPTETTLVTAGLNGACDFTFDANGDVRISSIENGSDHIYTIDSDGVVTAIAGYSNQDENAIAVDPVTGDLAVAQGDGSATSIGWSQAGAGVTFVVAGVTNLSSLYTAAYVGWGPTSIAWASDGCIYVPHFEGADSLSCVKTDGTVTTVVSGLTARPESVALDADEDLYVSLGAEIHRVTGTTTTLVATAGAPILDLVIDYDGTMYVETTAGAIERHADGASTEFATVTGQGKLAISPDGWLVRMVPLPVGLPTWEEWAL